MYDSIQNGIGGSGVCTHNVIPISDGKLIDEDNAVNLLPGIFKKDSIKYY